MSEDVPGYAPDSRETPLVPAVDVQALRTAAARWQIARQPVVEGSRYEAAREWMTAQSGYHAALEQPELVLALLNRLEALEVALATYANRANWYRFDVEDCLSWGGPGDGPDTARAALGPEEASRE